VGTYFRTDVPPARAEGGPLFDRPKRGRKKPHQLALAHCVRVAGQSALRRAARLCIGAANRKGPEGHPADSLRSNIDSHDAPLRREAAFLRRSAKGPEGGLVPITSDGSEGSSRSAALFGDGPSPVLLAGYSASRSFGDDGDDASPSIAIAPCCEPSGLAHSPVIFSVHEH